MDDEDETLDELIAEPLTTDRNALVVRAGHPILAQGDALHRALATYPWLVLSECVQLERALRDLVRKRGTPFNNSVIRTDSFHFFRSTLTASDCIGLTRYDAARPETEAGKVVELPLKQAKLLGAHRIGIMRRKDTPLTTAAQALVTEIYRQLGKKLPASLART
jgi:DNA-binding transcriptional LysR family regulator